MQMAKEYLQAYPSATNEQVVQALNISVRTVTNARAALIQMGLLPRSYFDRKNMVGPVVAPIQASTTDPITIEGIVELGKALETVQIGRGMSPVEMRERLSNIARRAAVEGAGSLEIAAIQAIAKLDSQSGERDKLGPGVPLSRADKVSRLSILMKICGQSITIESLINTFGKEVNGQSTQEDHSQPAEAVIEENGPGFSERSSSVCENAIREEPVETSGSSGGGS
jgi:hypothetical protein